VGENIEFRRPDGGKVEGYLAAPAARAAAGVVVLQEWWGLNDQIKGVAERLAAAGYRALVPDLYRGKLALEEKEAEHLMKNLDFADAAGQDVRGAVQYLKQSGSPKVAVMGYCMGGALTILAAVYVPEVDAAVPWYGCPPLQYVDAGRIRAPLLGHFGLKDSVFPLTLIEGLERLLRAGKVSFDFHRYDARHAFANEEADSKHLDYLRHDPAAAALAWERTMAFLRSSLASSGGLSMG
jgi:carboxymethylenebutenolidase